MTSRQSYTNSTGTGPFSYSGISLFADNLVPEQSQLKVFVSGVEKTYVSSAPEASQYTLNKVSKEVTLGASLASTDTLLIKRVTSQTSYVDFTNNSPLTAADLDITAKQSLFIAEEGIDAIAGGDAVLALPQLTDVLSTMSPSDGQFLRYDNATSKWQAQSFSPEGTGPDVNITTTFPSSAQEGDLIFHSTYGATYIYQGGEWRFVCGTGDTASAAAGTTVATLSFTGEQRLDQVTLPANWHCFIPATNYSFTGFSGGGVYSAFSNYSTANGDLIDITDSTQISSAERFDKLWFTSGVDRDGTTGELVISASAYSGEAVLSSGHQDIAGDGTSGSANVWWGGSSETNDAISASAILLPRLIDTDASDLAIGNAFESDNSNNRYRNLVWAYPAGINWGSQSWRVTFKGVSLQPGWNGNNNKRLMGMHWLPKHYPHLAKDANGWTVSQATDTGGLVAACNGDAQDARNVFTEGIFVGMNNGVGSTSNNYLLGYAGFGSVGDYDQEYLNFDVVVLHPSLPGGNSQPKNQHGFGNSNDTQSGNNGALTNKCIAYTVVVEYDATAKVMTVTETPDSSDTFKITSSSGPISVSTPASTGDILKAYLDSMSTDFWFGHGAGGSYIPTSSNWPDALTSIQIETL